MQQKIYRKLVRDRIPAIIRKDGGIPKTRTLSNAEFRKALFKKLLEEANEAHDTWCLEGVMDELADIQEVIAAIIVDLKIDTKLLDEVRRQRARVRGVFEKKVFLESVKIK